MVFNEVFLSDGYYIITWNAEGIPRLKTRLVSYFFVGSHKCAYPTDIRIKLRSGEFTFISFSISELPSPD